jgi:hypothetical protein
VASIIARKAPTGPLSFDAWSSSTSNARRDSRVPILPDLKGIGIKVVRSVGNVEVSENGRFAITSSELDI